jgi:type I restriction enzyme S subunit
MSGLELISFAEAPFEIIDGDRGKNYPKQSEFSDAGYCLFLSATNVTKTGFDFSSCQFIDEKRDAALNKGKLQREDIVLTTRGTIGNTAYFNDAVPFNHLRLNSGMVILRCDKTKLLPAFLYHFVRSPSFFSQVNGLRSGVAQPQLPIRDMRQIRLPVPPLSVQQQIAGILSAYDELIENSQRRIKILELMARALYREWFIDLRFPGHETVPRAAAPLREIPQGWAVKHLGDVVRFGNGKAIKPGGVGVYPVYGSNGIIGGSDKSLHENGVVIGRVGAYCGAVVYCRTKFWASDNTLVAYPASQQIKTEFLYHLLADANLSRYAGGAAQPLVTQAVLKQVEVLMPPVVLVEKFAELAGSFERQTATLHCLVQNLRRTRDLLLPRLLSGQIKVEAA